jgi:acyl-CoA hydrolase
MREGFELGWIAATLHCRSQEIDVFEIDKVVFLTPIKIGSVVTFTARVVFVHLHFLNVQVEVYKFDQFNNNQKVKAT